MATFNYHHLHYFWVVAREGTIAKACKVLDLAQPTISGQLRCFERSVKVKLFDRIGRNLVLTESGRTVYKYADEIFSLGRELQGELNGGPSNRPQQLVVGVADVLPKQIVFRLLEPALHLPEPVHLICHDDTTEQLLGRLALNELDIILSDVPASPLVKVRAYNHLLGECGVSFLAAADLAAGYRRKFPQSLNGAPILLPMNGTALRRSIDQWLDSEGIRPVVRGEFGDWDLFEIFGQAGLGIFAVPRVVEEEVQRQYRVRLVGRMESLRDRYYAISVERRLKHPAVVAITDAAKQKLFG